MAEEEQRMPRRWTIVAFSICLAVLLIAIVRVAWSPAYQARFAVARLSEQLGHGNLYSFNGKSTIFIPNPAFEKAVELGAICIDPLLERMQSGRLDDGQFAVMDLALLAIATARRKEQISVLGSYQRPVSQGNYEAIARAWSGWNNSGWPVIRKGKWLLPDLHVYPNLDSVLRPDDTSER